LLQNEALLQKVNLNGALLRNAALRQPAMTLNKNERDNYFNSLKISNANKIKRKLIF
jgi:hypothetical protein